MSCRKVGEMMSSRLDGRLEPERIAEMNSHLDCCSACCKRWKLLQLMSTRFETTPEPVPPPNFTSSVLARLDSVPKRSNNSHPWWILPSVLAGLTGILTFMLVALAMGGVWLTISHPALAGKAVSMAKLFTSATAATARALWSSFLLPDGQSFILTMVSGSVGLVLVVLWARLVRQWWQLGVDV